MHATGPCSATGLCTMRATHNKIHRELVVVHASDELRRSQKLLFHRGTVSTLIKNQDNRSPNNYFRAKVESSSCFGDEVVCYFPLFDLHDFPLRYGTLRRPPLFQTSTSTEHLRNPKRRIGNNLTSRIGA